jgi:hypothetical protein
MKRLASQLVVPANLPIMLPVVLLGNRRAHYVVLGHRSDRTNCNIRATDHLVLRNADENGTDNSAFLEGYSSPTIELILTF